MTRNATRDRGVVVPGLLRRADQFPLPLQEDFGGEVVVGWHHWMFDEALPGMLREPFGWRLWTPAEPVSAGGAPTAITGIFAYEDEDAVHNESYVWGSVALWGRVRDRSGDGRIVAGSLGEFAYPLELTVGRRSAASGVREKAEALAAAWGPMGVEVYYGVRRLA